MMFYPAIVHNEDNIWWCEFPDLEGLFVQEDTYEKMVKSAKDVLDGYLESLDSRKIRIPAPSNLSGDNIINVEVKLNIGFAISLKLLREKLGLTQQEVAERTGIKWAMYQRIENPRKSNPTLSTIEKLQKVFGGQINFTL